MTISEIGPAQPPTLTLPRPLACAQADPANAPLGSLVDAPARQSSSNAEGRPWGYWLTCQPQHGGVDEGRNTPQSRFNKRPRNEDTHDHHREHHRTPKRPRRPQAEDKALLVRFRFDKHTRSWSVRAPGIPSDHFEANTPCVVNSGARHRQRPAGERRLQALIPVSSPRPTPGSLTGTQPLQSTRVMRRRL